MAFTLANIATKPDIVEIISLQTTRKENNWKTKETLARTVVTLETERIKLVQSLMYMMMMNTKLFEQIIAYNGVLTDNKLYHEINSVTYITKFKKTNINYLLENGFYFEEEFMTIDPYSTKIVLMLFTL